jgi:hypothetical protein
MCDAVNLDITPVRLNLGLFSCDAVNLDITPVRLVLS